MDNPEEPILNGGTALAVQTLPSTTKISTERPAPEAAKATE
jgi:hypothetical protein